jgi:hypothetical protein
MKRVYAQDIALILERTIDLAESQLQVLEGQSKEFNNAIPRGWMNDFQMLTKALNDLTLAHARYTKAMDDYHERLSPEEKLEKTRQYALSIFNSRPDLVREWLERLQLDVDDTRKLSERFRMGPPDPDPPHKDLYDAA